MLHNEANMKRNKQQQYYREELVKLIAPQIAGVIEYDDHARKAVADAATRLAMEIQCNLDNLEDGEFGFEDD